MNIVAYCRVSTEKEDQLNSLQSQKIFFQEYADKNNHRLVCIYADEGISGTKIKNRTQFQKLLLDAKQGEFTMVVVKDISRFARNTVDLLNSTRTLKGLGIETIFLTGNMTVLGQSEFVLTIFGALAQEESANTSKRVKFGKEINAKKGRVPNLIYGYDKEKGEYFHLKINTKEASIINKIFWDYTQEGYGASKIAQNLNREGVVTKRGCQWSQNAITRILTNPIYIGQVINGKEEVEDFLTSKRIQKEKEQWHIVENTQLRIVEDTIFFQARDILEKRKKIFSTGHQRHSNRHLLSTILKCDCCGYSFRRVEKSYKNTYIRWVCSGRDSKGIDSCPNTIKLEETAIKESIENYFIRLLEEVPTAKKQIEKIFHEITDQSKQGEKCEKELQQQLKSIKIKRKKYMDLYEEELIDKKELQEKLSFFNHQMKKNQKEQKVVEEKNNPPILFLQRFPDLKSMISMDMLNNEKLKEVIEKIVVEDTGKVHVYIKGFLEEQTSLGCDNHT